ncbi:MAG: DUF2875 family protein [Propionivibrio sp.]|nr:DUF2875 family protein [Propionivibrio sp.]MBP8898600.1 DUF2875 family protein [Sulfuritalea sp.]
MAFAQPNRRLLLWLLPPLLLLVAVFGGCWFYLSSQAKAEETRQAAIQSGQDKQQADAAAQAAAVLATKRETLEVLGVGLVVEKFRNAAVWEAIKTVENDPHASILPKEPEVIGDLVRGNRAGKRSSDVYEYATHYFVEKIPLPGFVISRRPTGKEADLWEAGAGELMGTRDPFTLFITAGQIYSDTPDEAFGVIFDFFDAHPDVPAVFVASADGYISRKFFRGYSPDDVNGDPGWKPGDPTEAMTAFVLVRRDRVDKLIRPFAVDEKFGLDYDDKTSFVNRVWRFFFSIKKRHTDSALPTVEEWIAEVPKLMAETKDVPVSGLLPFWHGMPDGFKPSPWIPVPWTQWQLKEFDDLPTLGYLHRPQYAKYVAADGKPLPEKERVSAFSAAWQGALETLPEGKAPERMFFDAGGIQGKARCLVPMTRSLSENHPDQHWLDTSRAIDLSARLDDTGAASPFVQIALAIIAGYRDGGVSATVNLRREDGASVLMVSPPSEPPEGRKPHPGAGQSPFKVPLMPENGQ